MNPRALTVSTALAAYNGELRLDAELLLAACLGVQRATLLARPERDVPAGVAARFAQLMERRRRGEPVAYLVGEKEFWSLPLKVTADVLVPRPETETLVEAALAAGGGATQLTVLELGTGSGAIALALAKERPHWRITATDRSATALGVARENAARLGLTRVEFLSGDWYVPVAARRFDLVVSNPPYIAAADPALAAPELAFEPRDALVAGVTGLEALQIIVEQAPRHLREAGRLLLEHGWDQGARLRSLLAAAGFSNIRTLHDLAGRERVTAGELK
jgi:release factor glutamine methyltransferase